MGISSPSRNTRLPGIKNSACNHVNAADINLLHRLRVSGSVRGDEEAGCGAAFADEGAKVVNFGGGVAFRPVGEAAANCSYIGISK